MATINTGNGDDLINGTSGADKISAGTGDDTVYAGAGNDDVNGGSGSDLLDGGSGSDKVDGGSGNDIFIYTLSDYTTGSNDLYTGGSGYDAVRVMLTGDQWNDATVQQELGQYFAHLLAVQRNTQGEVSNGIARDFTFEFGPAFGNAKLTVQMMEELQIYVDGVAVTNLDAPFIDGNDSTTTGQVVEDGDTDSSLATAQSATGTLTFVDLDWFDSHSYSTTPPAGALGSIALLQLDDSTGDGVGHLQWTYALNNASAGVQQLAAGQTVTEVHQVRIQDSNNANNFVLQNVTVTVTGTNDAPTITVAGTDALGAVTEDATTPNLSDSGTIAFNDIDLIDVHSTSVAPAAGNPLGGTLVLGAVSEDAGTEPGTVGWTYTVGNAAVQYLAAGQTASESFTVTIDDGEGGTVDQVVTVTVTGTNDDPTITVAGTDALGAVTEDATTPNLSDSGTIAFNDIDLIDVHSTSVAPAAGNPLGGTLVLGAVSEDAGTEPGTVGWTYTVGNAAVQYLAAGQTASESFTVTIDDGEGGTVDQVVTVTVTGTNDDPTITVAGTDALGAVTEDATTPNLSDSGTIAFNDIDLIDVHSTSVAPAAGNPLGGTLVLGAVSEDAGTEPGTVGWTYTVGNAAVQYLAAGQTASESFTVTIDDGEGGTVDQVVTVTVTGTNDDPTITVAGTDALGAVTEDATTPNLSDSGTIAFNDIDLIDVHSTSVAPAAGNPLGGTLVLGAVSESAGTEPGTVGWTYTVGNAAVQYLAAGQTASESFTVTIDDGEGGTVDQVVTVTVTGTNDDPTITVAGTDALGAVTEDATTPNLSDSGTIAFNDIDLIDVHSTSVAPAAGNPLGGTLVMGAVSEDAGTEPGTVGWTYTVGNAAVQYLAAGQTASESFTVTIDDGEGGTVDQVVTVTVTGTNDAPTITVAGTDALGAVTEDATTPNLSDSGTIAFNDIDLIDVHSTSVAPAAGNPLGGTLVLGAVSEDAGTEPGTVGWTYTVGNAAVQYLAAGQTASESFTVTIDDGEGGTVDQVVTVTVTGTNDAPTITVAGTDALGAVTEDATTPNLSDSGTIAFNDIDLIDVHSTSVAPAAGNPLGGTLVLGAVSEDAGTEPGTVGWTYTVGNAAVQYLAAGQTASESFTVTIDDGEGGTVDQVVTVTVTGTNDDPTITVGGTDALGAVTEDATTPNLSDSGTIAFNDIDLIDVHSTSVAPAAGNPLGGTLVLGAVSESAGTEPGTVGWTYTVGNAAVQYLAAGQTASESFTVTIDDGEGGTVDQVVTVTVTGTNDAPTITVAGTDALGAVTEDATTPNLSDSGTIAFNDIDLIDVHTTSVAPAAGNPLGGTLVLGAVSEDAGTEPGTVGWTYTVGNAAVQYLAAGQTASESFTVTIDDGEGGTVDQVVTVTVTGTNDAPTITVAGTDALGAVTEDATTPNLSDSGTIAFNDIDLIDVHSTSVAPAAGNPLGGTLVLGAVSEDASTEPGTVGWTYTVGNAAVQYLAAGQTASESFTVTIDDGEGGTVDQVVTVTVTGTNDDPTITVAGTDALGAVTEDATTPNLSDSGTIAFNDIDLIDVHSTSVAPAAGNPLGGTLVLGAVSESAGTEPGTVGWTYTVGNAAVQYLAAGQTASESFTVTIDDGEGGTVDQVVTVTVTGTNDAPTISVGAGDSAAKVLSETNAGLSTSGTLSVTDVDLANTVSSTVTAVVAAGTTTGLGLTNAQLLAMLSVAPTTGLAADVGDANNLTWSFDSGTQAFNYLGAGESLVLTYTVQSTDNSPTPASDTQTVTVTINGSNDAAPDITITLIESAIPTNNLPTGAFAQFSVVALDGSGPVTFAMSGLVEMTHAGAVVADASPDLALSSGGVLSASSIDDNRVYEFNVTASQGAANVSESFSVITGSTGSDTITLAATAGDDAIYVRNGNDAVFAGDGDDSVAGQGNTDQIHGGAGNDTLYGGGGNDTFYFDTALDPVTNVDAIRDFDADGADLISLSAAFFGAIGPTLSSTEFVAAGGSATVAADVRIIYDSSTGNVYYDTDGGSDANRTLFADVTLTDSGDTFNHNDFTIAP